MKCPYCGFPESKVVDSRPAEEGTTIRRRRECQSCQKRFTTYEIIERIPLVVVKKDGRRQTFDKVKLLNGMIRACEKRPVTVAELQEVADNIEQEVQNSLEREVSSSEIGELDVRNGRRFRFCRNCRLCLLLCLGLRRGSCFRRHCGGTFAAAPG